MFSGSFRVNKDEMIHNVSKYSSMQGIYIGCSVVSHQDNMFEERVLNKGQTLLKVTIQFRMSPTLHFKIVNKMLKIVKIVTKKYK